MRTDVLLDLSKSAQAFLDIVWPKIKGHLGNGKLIPIESPQANDTNLDLDVLAGIDAWQVCHDDGRMRGIASRIQWMVPPARPYNTFSVRTRRPNRPTELQKRLEALNSTGEWLFPAITAQAYLDKNTNSFLTCGLIHTKDLFRYISHKGIHNFDEKDNLDGSSSFIAISWDELQKANIQILCWGNNHAA